MIYYDVMLQMFWKQFKSITVHGCFNTFLKLMLYLVHVIQIFDFCVTLKSICKNNNKIMFVI